MGLDITVNVTASKVRAALEDGDSHITHPEIALKLLENFPDDATIHTRPGSYGGLHRVREAYIALKKLDSEPGISDKDQGIPKSHVSHHLLSHSDCDGWYIPDDFDEPLWGGSISIGSSVRLLKELQELELQRSHLPEQDVYGWGRSWDAVYLAAVASVACREPIRFC